MGGAPAPAAGESPRRRRGDALRLVRARGPRELIAAVAVAPPESVAALEPLADHIVCLETPSWFFAVGQFFEDFRQVEDEEVAAILRAAARPRAADEP